MTSYKPLISIVTVVYNGFASLEQTIKSVLNQSYSNIEYIIIDGGSTDGSLDIIKKYEDKIAIYISEPDNGLYDAMNKGIAHAKGLLIGLINSDDWYEQNAVALVVESYNNNPQKKIFYGDKKCVLPNNDSFIRKANNNDFLIKYHGMILNHPTMFIHNDVYKKYSYNTSLSSLSDYQLVLSAYLEDKTSFQYIPALITNYRIGGISARLSLHKSIKENYIARRNAGMTIFQCFFGILIRISLEIFRVFKR